MGNLISIKLKKALSLILIHTLVSACSKTQFSTVRETAAARASATDSGGGTDDQKPPQPILNNHTLNVPITGVIGAPVDILLVIDNSGSMREDVTKLASKMDLMFQSLAQSQINWQMCIISTHSVDDGESYSWHNSDNLPISSGIILNRNITNTTSIVSSTIDYIFSRTNTTTAGDERGIAMAYRHMNKTSNSACYRSGANFSMIIISDEDERSVGETDYSYIADPARRNTAGPNHPIEDIDRPEFYHASFLNLFPNKKIQAHSIVIPSYDLTCFNQQLIDSKVSYGKFYESLSALTKGSVTSICEQDYSVNIDVINSIITNQSKTVLLDCIPKSRPVLTVTPLDSKVTFDLKINELTLKYPSNKSYSVKIDYSCN